MGLDMYAYFVKKENVVNDEEFNFVYGQEEDFYWRKDYQLHDWIEQLWEKRTGNTNRNDFNCVKFRLYEPDIKDLEKAINSWEVDDSEPFSYSKYMSNMREHDLRFCYEAKKAINSGYAVYYDSWW